MAIQNQYYYFIIHLQFLGFRYSGWQKQPGQKTIESMLVKTLKFVLQDRKFKILGTGRTDSKVSALHTAFELFLEDKPLEDQSEFLAIFNKNLPPDIRAVGMVETNAQFNIIKHSKIKEYVYLFSFGEKSHPFCAPFMANFQEDLDIKLMMSGALLFAGTHNFVSYTARIKNNTQVIRTVTTCLLKKNTLLTANFFPEKSFALHIEGQGFMRYQVRMIMGALILLGKGELTLDDIRSSLSGTSGLKVAYVAPGSGLILNKTEFI